MVVPVKQINWKMREDRDCSFDAVKITADLFHPQEKILIVVYLPEKWTEFQEMGKNNRNEPGGKSKFPNRNGRVHLKGHVWDDLPGGNV